MLNIGVLALQGDFAEHSAAFKETGVGTQEVRRLEEFGQIDALVIPGGESTTMAHLLDIYQLRKPLLEKAKEGLPIWGTCAGMILMANSLTDNRPTPLGLMDIDITRNAFGRQVDSFEMPISIPCVGTDQFPAIFIRAPVINKVGNDVEVLARLEDQRIVAARQGNRLATAFHPELTHDNRLHRYFLEMVASSIEARQ